MATTHEDGKLRRLAIFSERGQRVATTHITDARRLGTVASPHMEGHGATGVATPRFVGAVPRGVPSGPRTPRSQPEATEKSTDGGVLCTRNAVCFSSESPRPGSAVTAVTRGRRRGDDANGQVGLLADEDGENAGKNTLGVFARSDKGGDDNGHREARIGRAHRARVGARRRDGRGVDIAVLAELDIDPLIESVDNNPTATATAVMISPPAEKYNSAKSPPYGDSRALIRVCRRPTRMIMILHPVIWPAGSS